MQVLHNPSKSDWKQILQRPYADNSAVLKTVDDILQTVKATGDIALKAYAKKFDGVVIDELQVSQNEIDAAANQLSIELKNAIGQAKKNIEIFHQKTDQRSRDY